MLRYSPEQQAVVLNNRRMFNNHQNRLAELHGSTFIGNASPLPKDVWGQWDREAVQIQRDELLLFNDIAASAQRPIPIGKFVTFFQTVTESGEVNVSLDGRSKARTDQPTIEYHGTPIPIIDSGFSYSWRQMAAAETEGYALDSAGRDNGNRRVAEKLEDAAMYGYANVSVAGDTSYGLLNHPERSTRTTGVALNGATAAQWMAEVIATLELLHASNYRRNITLYVNTDDWFYAGSTEFAAGYSKTIAQRVMELPGLSEIVPIDRLPVSNLLALVKSRKVVQVLNAMPMTTRAKFRANPEDDFDFTVMAAAALEIKYDAEGNIGIAHSAP